ncbi:MAG: 6-bladed beta-propeller [bacterium]|nr:6-bladed beta-propeller [bacterium]
MNIRYNKKKQLLVLLVVLPVLVIGIFYAITITKEKKINVKIELIMQYGKDEISEEEMFGLISSFTLDQNQNLYVADDAFKVIKKFSKEGKLIQTFGYGPGKGPGELSNLHNICVDDSCNVYVIDKINKNVNVYDSLNHLITTFKLPFLPAQIIAVRPLIVDVMGFPFTYNGDLIHRYNLLNVYSDKPEMIYCERPKGRNAKMNEISGFSGILLKSPGGYIYYSYFYPYIINKYSEDGKLLLIINGTRSVIAPYYEPGTRIIKSPSVVREVAILPGDIILILVDIERGKEVKQYFDFIDGKNGEYLGSVSCTDLGLEEVRFIRSDVEGNIYLDKMDPYPHILKYKLFLE